MKFAPIKNFRRQKIFNRKNIRVKKSSKKIGHLTDKIFSSVHKIP